ncbi:hypothetical protein VUR80DRAFT_8011 [Thermomyces stellatus]
MAGARLLVIFQWGRRLGWDDAYSFPPCVDCVCFVCSWDKKQGKEHPSKIERNGRDWLDPEEVRGFGRMRRPRLGTPSNW